MQTNKYVCIYIYILKRSCVQILSLVSYALRLFFQRKKKKREYMQIETKSEDVQTPPLNVYCTVYSICLIRRVNVSILPVTSRIPEVNVYSGLVSGKMADWLLSLGSRAALTSAACPNQKKKSPPSFSFFVIACPSLFSFFLNLEVYIQSSRLSAPLFVPVRSKRFLLISGFATSASPAFNAIAIPPPTPPNKLSCAIF